jgi:hypothetical protein
VKKSSHRKPSRIWRWIFLAIGRLATCRAGFWLAAPILLLLVFAAWPDPQRAERLRAEADALAGREEAIAAAATPAAPNSHGVTDISFKWLSFPLRSGSAVNAAGEPAYDNVLPARIRQFEGADVRIRDFMVPTLDEGGKVREFMILPSRMTCCYGQSPRFCEFITARMQGRAIPAKMDEPNSFEGVLHVGDVYVNGYWSALYTLDCTQVSR